MQNSASRRHPLDVARAELAAVTNAIAMLDRADQDIGYGLDPTMWMPGKASPEIVGIVVPEIVEQQEWIELVGLAKAERPMQHARLSAVGEPPIVAEDDNAPLPGH
jgi:hypothetical protein